MSWDVLVVGGGIAGLNAAASARQHGAERVAVMTNRPVGEGGCISKVHGINVGFTESDQKAHYEETIASSKGLADPKLVDVLCSEIGTRIRHLERGGLHFQSDDTGYLLGRYGGCDEPRALNCLDFTGRELANTLGREVLAAGCWVFDDLSVVSLLSYDGECVGVLAYRENEGTFHSIHARAVVLACGGGLASVRPSTNPSEKYLAGISAAGRSGATLIDLELTQFHPTGLWLGSSAKSGEIIEEELRTMGGILVNSEGERFAGKYSPLREMATRDVVARAIALEVYGGKGIDGSYVWLDITGIDRSLLASRFPYTMHRLRSFGHDLLDSTRLPIYPASHFILGGIMIDCDGASSVPYLYACGEDAGGVHGANRLGGNGVAESLVFGHRAGAAAARHGDRQLPDRAYSDRRPRFLRDSKLSFDEIVEIGGNLGPVRSGAGLRAAETVVDEMLGEFDVAVDESFVDGQVDHIRGELGMELWLRLQGLKLLLGSANAREECLGPHYRTDFTEDQVEARAGGGYRHTVTRWIGDGPATLWPGLLPKPGKHQFV